MTSLKVLTLKYVVVGDLGVGKSCLVGQFTHSKFQEAHLTTIGVSLAEVTRSLSINDSEVRIQVWDTAGMEFYRSLTASYYRNTAVIILVYDVTRRHTFENLTSWLREIRTSTNNPHVILLVVGNKIDLDKQREVSKEEGQQFAVANKLLFMETSAKIKETVEKVFFLTCRMYYEKIDMGYINVYTYPFFHGIKLENDGDDENFCGNVSKGRSNCFC